MYGSFRFYIDKYPKTITAKMILDIFELFSVELGMQYKHIRYLLFEADNDKMRVNKKYSFNSDGKNEFLAESIIPLLIGKHGDLSAPFISAEDDCAPNELYKKSHVEIQFALYDMPLIICVDQEQSVIQRPSLNNYSIIIQSLETRGFHVNNSFYHVYSQKNSVACFDCEQFGMLKSLYEHTLIKKSVQHSVHRRKNHIMDIFCSNSCSSELISENDIHIICDIVGMQNVIMINGIILFALSDLTEITPLYRIKYCKKIQKMRRLLSYCCG